MNDVFGALSELPQVGWIMFWQLFFLNRPNYNAQLTAHDCCEFVHTWPLDGDKYLTQAVVQ